MKNAWIRSCIFPYIVFVCLYMEVICPNTVKYGTVFRRFFALCFSRIFENNIFVMYLCKRFFFNIYPWLNHLMFSVFYFFAILFQITAAKESIISTFTFLISLLRICLLVNVWRYFSFVKMLKINTGIVSFGWLKRCHLHKNTIQCCINI